MELFKIFTRKGINQVRIKALLDENVLLKEQLERARRMLPTSKEWREFTLYKESKK